MPDTTPKRRGRILVSLLLLLLTVGVVPLLWTSRQLVSESRQMLEDDQKQLQFDKARALSQQVGEYLASIRGRVHTIAKTLEMDTDTSGIAFATRLARMLDAKALVRFTEEDSPIYYIGVVDPSGRGPSAGQDFYDTTIRTYMEESFAQALQGNSVVSNPVMWKVAKEPMVVVAEPVRHGDDVQGVVVAVASLGPLWKMAKDLAEGASVEVYIVDRRGQLVAHSDPQRLEGTLDLSGLEIVKDFIASGGAISSSREFQIPVAGAPPRQMLGSYRKVPDDSGLGIIVQVDLDKAYHAVDQMRRQSTFLVAGVTVLAVLVGVWFAGQISQPIRQLARGARQLATGDYATRVSVSARNEVGELADAFNLMGEDIQKAMVEIQKQSETNKELFMGSIKMLANAIDEKDPYTRGHSERVAYYSMVIAKHLGMSEEEVEKVYLSGIIHDVGKIGIEDKILRKPAALTDEEYEIMKQHPTKGAHILDAVPVLKAMAGAGLQHHENIDGSGYPDKLKGDEIPLLGRIVSVADAFDAMTTDRPYSKAMTFEASLARLRFLAGKKFDPDCVTAMEKAGAAGDLSTAKARRASVESRKQPAPAEAAATAVPSAGASPGTSAT
jgi:HD-GYP domain-containing protein (c-di-GMP phosphodiesterase class II)